MNRSKKCQILLKKSKNVIEVLGEGIEKYEEGNCLLKITKLTNLTNGINLYMQMFNKHPES